MRSPSSQQNLLPPRMPAAADPSDTPSILAAFHALTLEIDPITQDKFSDVIAQRRAHHLPTAVVLMETHLNHEQVVLHGMLASQMPNDIADLTHDPVNRQPIKSLHIGLALPAGQWLTFEHIEPALAQLFGDADRCADSKKFWKPEVAQAKLFLAAILHMRSCHAGAEALIGTLKPHSRNRRRSIGRAAYNLLTTPPFLNGAFDQHRPSALTASLLAVAPYLSIHRKADLLDNYASFASFDIFKSLLRSPGFEANMVRTEHVDGELHCFTPLYRLLHDGEDAIDAAEKVALLKRDGGKSFFLLSDD